MTTIILQSHAKPVSVDITASGELVLSDDAEEALEYDIAYEAMGGGESELGIVGSKSPTRGDLRYNLMRLLRVLSFDDIRNSVIFMADCLDHANAQLVLASPIQQNATKVSGLLRRWVYGGAVLSVEDAGLEDLRRERVEIGIQFDLTQSQHQMFDALRMATDVAEQYTLSTPNVHGAFLIISWVLDSLGSLVAYVNLGDEGWNEARDIEVRWQVRHLAEVIADIQAKGTI